VSFATVNGTDWPWLFGTLHGVSGRTRHQGCQEAWSEGAKQIGNSHPLDGQTLFVCGRSGSRPDARIRLQLPVHPVSAGAPLSACSVSISWILRAGPACAGCSVWAFEAQGGTYRTSTTPSGRGRRSATDDGIIALNGAANRDAGMMARLAIVAVPPSDPRDAWDQDN